MFAAFDKLHCRPRDHSLVAEQPATEDRLCRHPSMPLRTPHAGGMGHHLPLVPGQPTGHHAADHAAGVGLDVGSLPDFYIKLYNFADFSSHLFGEADGGASHLRLPTHQAALGKGLGKVGRVLHPPAGPWGGGHRVGLLVTFQ